MSSKGWARNESGKRVVWSDHLEDPEMFRKISDLVKAGHGRKVIGAETGLAKDVVTKLIRYIREGDPSTKLAFSSAKERIRLQDKNRVLNNIVRSEVRFTNAMEELLKELTANVKVYKFNKLAPGKSGGMDDMGTPIGIVQLADCHMNELVDLIDTIYYNEYNYDIVCARLEKFACETIRLFEAYGIDTILVANTGDTLNSDRRLDEILTNAGNRSRAMLIAVDIVSQFLAHLSSRFHVYYLTVLGNESRKYDELTWNSKTFTNNYDFDIHYLLQQRLPDINFLPIDGGFERCTYINGQNILFIHGQQFKPKDLEHSITKLFAKYAQAGHIINFVITGHIHNTCNSDYYARSSSLVGDNAYSNNCLQLKGKAAQNLYIVTSQGISTMAVDLQRAEGYTRYTYDKTMAVGTGQKKSRTKADEQVRKPITILTI